MGKLVEGVWYTDWYAPDEKGRFVRPDTQFRRWVTADGSSGFPVESGRYHLYIARACPWAHRAVLMRALRGLDEAISMTVVDPYMGDDGWAFSDAPGCQPDPLHGARFLRELYVHADPTYTGRVTVPVLWDRERDTIVNNESREIMRMLDTVFDPLAKDPVSFWPAEGGTGHPEGGELREAVDEAIDAIYQPVNNGVYRAGFARSQEAYEEAAHELFDALDRWDELLGRQRYLCGDVVTEADWALFTTLVRFDAVYHGHFKCNLRRIADYPNLSGYVRELYQLPGVRETVDFDHIKRHYYESHETVNPTRIVPIGPELDLESPHGRDAVGPGRLAR